MQDCQIPKQISTSIIMDRPLRQSFTYDANPWIKVLVSGLTRIITDVKSEGPRMVSRGYQFAVAKLKASAFAFLYRETWLYQEKTYTRHNNLSYSKPLFLTLDSSAIHRPDLITHAYFMEVTNRLPKSRVEHWGKAHAIPETLCQL